MKMTAVLCVVFFCATLPAGLARAAELGMDAPPLQIAEWTKGEPVDLDKLKDKVVVVEFWATWCPPCRTSIPHLTQLQKKYKDDLIIVGVTSEEPGVVKPFLEKMGADMDYTVAVDSNNETARAYMTAFGQGGIPYAFIVDKQGKLVWHDSPMSPQFEKILGEVVAGSFDLKEFQAARAEMDKNVNAANEYIQRLQNGDNTEETKQLGKQVLASLDNEPMLLSQLALIIATGELADPPFDIAQAAADNAVKLTNGQDWMALTAQAQVLKGMGKLSEAIKVQEKALGLAEDPREKQMLQKTYDDMVAAQEPVVQ